MPRVEHVQIDQAAELQPPVEAHVAARGQRAGAQRHRFVVRLIGGGAAQHEELRRRVVLVEVAGVVVVDLVIVPGDHPRRRGVRRHQVAVRFVQRVAVAIVDERVELVAVVLAEAAVVPAAVGAPFVDVVAGVEDEIELLVRDAPEGGEVAVLVVLAAADREAQAIDRRAGGRRGPRAADLADSSPARKRKK